ncbi:FHA domain-containing protein, partial [Kocuria sp. HSID17582]|uniref:FHA domain-containing protein n=1 Tax=Kocuria sp. HSID17582 TaxID=2419512 RepID=UPI001EE93DD4
EGPLAGSSYQPGSAPLMLGRSPEATVPLEDDYASGRHARLFPQGSRGLLEALRSTHRTFPRDQKPSPAAHADPATQFTPRPPAIDLRPQPTPLPLPRAAAVDPGMQFRVGRTVMELRP